MTPDRFGDEPVIAWRAWYADVHGRLYGMTHRVEWPECERFEATCQYWRFKNDRFTTTHGSMCPRNECTCGIHAWRTAANANHLMLIPSLSSRLTRVVGQVSLWGNVIEHERGYRAQYAYPYSITTGDQTLAQRLRKNYRVDVDVRTLP